MGELDRAEDGFPVKGDALRSQLFSVPDCQRIVKKAVARRLERAYGQRWFAETGVKYQIVFFLFRNVATLMIDTSGAPLYKRGYRTETGEAPLRETLAAGHGAAFLVRAKRYYCGTRCADRVRSRLRRHC